MYCEFFFVEGELGNRVVDNIVSKSFQSKSSIGKKRGRLNFKEKSKVNEKEKNKKKSKVDGKENKKMVLFENFEICVLFQYNYFGRSDEDSFVCYICFDVFDEFVYFKNYIVNFYLCYILIQEFVVCLVCGLVCRLCFQFVEYVFKFRNVC